MSRARGAFRSHSGALDARFDRNSREIAAGNALAREKVEKTR